MHEQVGTPGLYALDTAARLAGLPRARVIRYVRVGLVRPARQIGRRQLFGDEELFRLRRIRRLSEDLGLNLPGIEVAMRLLDQIAALQEDLDRGEG